jgi:hypothetical protein
VVRVGLGLFHQRLEQGTVEKNKSVEVDPSGKIK